MLNMLNQSRGVAGKAMTRRDVLKTGLKAGLKAGVLGGALLPAMLTSAPVRAATSLAIPAGAGAMKVSFRNQHTGESFKGVYRIGNRYMPEAFEQINRILRDFRTGEEFPIDPRLMDIVFAMSDAVDTNKSFEILSGYRSAKTNAYLRRVTDGVAQNSLHMTGQAVDLRLPGYSTTKLYRLARTLRAGGTGYYAKSNFVHLDTGQVRHWS